MDNTVPPPVDVSVDKSSVLTVAPPVDCTSSANESYQNSEMQPVVQHQNPSNELPPLAATDTGEKWKRSWNKLVDDHFTQSSKGASLLCMQNI